MTANERPPSAAIAAAWHFAHGRAEVGADALDCERHDRGIDLRDEHAERARDENKRRSQWK
jgi:hypothetical protein